MMEFSWMAGGRDKLEGWRQLNKAVSAPGTTSWKQIVNFWAFWAESYFLAVQDSSIGDIVSQWLSDSDIVCFKTQRHLFSNTH